MKLVVAWVVNYIFHIYVYGPGIASLNPEGAKLAMLSDREGWDTLFPPSITMTLANH